MSEVETKPNSVAERPSTAGRNMILSGDKKDSLVKLYFNELESKGIKDPFVKWYRTSENGIEIIKPPLNPASLVKIIQENSYLSQCIDAMVTNIHGFGYRLEFIHPDIDASDPGAKQELQYLEEFFDTPNTYSSFTELRENIAWDYWVFGNAFVEITRDNKGRVITLHHIPASTMRVTKIDKQSTPVTETLMRLGKKISVTSQKNFRRYVQIDELTNVVYFKEFGDPRLIDPKNGKENTGLTFDTSATEVIHLSRYNAQSVYGLPIWYTQLPSILGSRQAELTNLDFFENNAVPALAILVSGGYLTTEAFDFLRANFDAVKGRGSVNKVVVLEARGAVEDAGQNGVVPTPTIQMKPLYAERQNDALFQEFDRQCEDKIRSVFRLPAVFTGQAKDYTYASAKTSLEVAENQIFTPERTKFDDIINNKILSTWDLQFYRFRSNTASLVTSEDVLKAIEVFETAGAMTPNIAIGILNEKMNLDIPEIKNFWGDIPFEVINSIMRAQGSADKTNFVVDAFELLEAENIEDLKNFKPRVTQKPAATAGSQDAPKPAIPKTTRKTPTRKSPTRN